MRLARLNVNMQTMIWLLVSMSDPTKRLQVEGLPADAEVAYVQPTFRQEASTRDHMIDVFITSDTFVDIKPGQQVPVVSVRIVTHYLSDQSATPPVNLTDHRAIRLRD